MDSRIYILTHKRLTDQLSSVEQQELTSLIRIPDNKAVAQEIEYLWNVSKNYFPAKDWKKDEAKDAFLQKIRTAPTPRATAAAAAAQPAKGLNWGRIAVAIIALLALGWLIANAFGPKVETIKAAEAIEYAELYDGTKVWLEDGAQLKVMEEDKNQRMVALEGQALFDVTHNPDQPFLVDLGKGLMVEVLGTAFNAKSTHDGTSGVVTVREGKVRLYSSTNSTYDLIISAGEQGEMNPTEGTQFKDVATVYTAISPDLDPLTFDEAPLSKVFDQLGLFYGVQFEYEAEALEKCLISTVVHPNTELDETIQVIMDIHPEVRILPTVKNSYQVKGSCQ